MSMHFSITLHLTQVKKFISAQSLFATKVTQWSFAGYGVQAGPTNGQQMKGNGMTHHLIEDTHTHTYVEKQQHL